MQSLSLPNNGAQDKNMRVQKSINGATFAVVHG
jgi:hypothetical protein